MGSDSRFGPLSQRIERNWPADVVALRIVAADPGEPGERLGRLLTCSPARADWQLLLERALDDRRFSVRGAVEAMPGRDISRTWCYTSSCRRNL